MIRHFLSNIFHLKKNSDFHYFSLHFPPNFQCLVSIVHCLEKDNLIVWKHHGKVHPFSKPPHFPLKSQTINSKFLSQAFTSPPACDLTCIDIALQHIFPSSHYESLWLGVGVEDMDLASKRPRIKSYLQWVVTVFLWKSYCIPWTPISLDYKIGPYHLSPFTCKTLTHSSGLSIDLLYNEIIPLFLACKSRFHSSLDRMSSSCSLIMTRTAFLHGSSLSGYMSNMPTRW